MNTLYKNAKRYFNRLTRRLHRRDIETRLLVLVLTAGILSFLTLSGLSFYAIGNVRDAMDELGERIGRAGATFTEDLMTRQLKDTLGELAYSRAEFIEHETKMVKQNVTILSHLMTNFASNPDAWRAIKLRDPRVDAVENFMPYITYSSESYANGTPPDNLTPEIRRNIEVAANIRVMLAPLAKTYTGYRSSFFVGSKDGWTICINVVPQVRGQLFLTNERLYHYDSRQRPWYISAINETKPVFSDLYVGVTDDSAPFIACSVPYFDKNGVAGVVGLDFSISDMYAPMSQTLIGESGFSFVLNKDGHILFSTRTEGEIVAQVGGKDLRESSEETLADAARKMVNGESGTELVVVDGEEYFLAFAPMKSVGWSFGTLTARRDVSAIAVAGRDYFLSQIEVFNSRLQGEYFLIIFAALVLWGWLLNSFFSLSKDLSARFVKPIHTLADGVRDIIKDQSFDKKIDIKTGDEIEHLATCFNAMTGELKAYMANLTKVTAEKERIATELDVATEIQRGMLPKDFPTRDDFEILATMTPAKEVGGDFYDFYFLDETHVAITVADVSGKGIPAALFMVISKTVLNNFAASFYQSNGLAPVVEAANEKLCANNDAMMFVTAFVGVLDLESGEFTFVNAGHNPPVIYHAAENRCDFLDVKKNFVMGPMDGIPFVEQKINFNAGDLIFIYTDGVTEALNVANEEYLPDRLIKFMNSTDCRVDLDTLLKNIRADVAAHVGDAAQSDDITLFALRFKGSRNHEA